MYEHVYVRLYVLVYVRMYVRVYVRRYVRLYVQTYVRAHVRVRVLVYARLKNHIEVQEQTQFQMFKFLLDSLINITPFQSVVGDPP